MSNSCHMQYGHALRWAWGCLMRSSLILEERGREHEGAERDLNHKQNSSGWLWANLSVYLSRQQHFYFHYFCVHAYVRACSSWIRWIRQLTFHFLTLSVKIHERVLKSNALKSNTGRYYPGSHRHPWDSFVFVLCTRPKLKARVLWHHATWCGLGSGLSQEPVSEVTWPPVNQNPLAKPDPFFFLYPKRPLCVNSFADKQQNLNNRTLNLLLSG